MKSQKNVCFFHLNDGLSNEVIQVVLSKELENSLKYDYGAEDEFLPLHGQCFEYTEREYTYKLCPFDVATQRPKDGHGETNLG